MTDLDRKIAELKRWRHVPAGTETVIRGMRATLSEGWMEPLSKGGEWYHAAFNCNWSTSDSKALELVDELGQHHPSRMWKFFFRLDQLENGQGWRAVFWQDLQGKMIPPRKYTGQDPTRPKAICRAYIAAVTWMRGKKDSGLDGRG